MNYYKRKKREMREIYSNHKNQTNNELEKQFIDYEHTKNRCDEGLKNSGFKTFTKLFEMKGLDTPLDDLPRFYKIMRERNEGVELWKQHEVFKYLIHMMKEEEKKLEMEVK
ncbi:MAG: hypothetical protein HN464_04500 [Candidatus Marinimicrobia bacterium]|jgi:hypothetical protein|nr:hypothetical protein [Candidatus Neomarinimicrobiota bacterium]